MLWKFLRYFTQIMKLASLSTVVCNSRHDSYISQIRFVSQLYGSCLNYTSRVSTIRVVSLLYESYIVTIRVEMLLYKSKSVLYESKSCYTNQKLYYTSRTAVIRIKNCTIRYVYKSQANGVLAAVGPWATALIKLKLEHT